MVIIIFDGVFVSVGVDMCLFMGGHGASAWLGVSGVSACVSEFVSE